MYMVFVHGKILNINIKVVANLIIT